MRLWSLHPSYLDSRGLVACWREGLLARKVLSGGTHGYRNHPQLERFREAERPLFLLDIYLTALYYEADGRNYNFDSGKIRIIPPGPSLPVTAGQLLYEMGHLTRKLETRNPGWLRMISREKPIETNPVFRTVPGEIEPWERIS